MRGIVTLTYFNSHENNLSTYTKRTFQHLREQVKYPSIIVAVDNGSEDKSANSAIEQVSDEMIILDKPMSIAYGINIGWYRHREELLSGNALAIKLDADVLIEQDDWLDIAMDTLQSNPEIGILSGWNEKAYTYQNFVVEERDGWFVSTYAYGITSIRSPQAFCKIGYLWQPYGRWGWGDHYDAKRINRHTDLVIGVSREFSWKQCSPRSALSNELKQEYRKKGKANLLKRMSQIENGQHPVFEDFTP